MQVAQSDKLANVSFEIRGPVYQQARQMELDGQHIMKLNLGNPAAFGFEAPEEVLRDVIHNVRHAHGYSNSKGIADARSAILRYYTDKGVPGLDIDHIYLGNGVSELAGVAMQALLEDGDEVLVPAPDYPLWTTSVALCGGRPVYYRCDEASGWFPDVTDLAAKVTPRTRAIVLINPNNPTGAVYSPELLAEVVEVARRHQLIVFSDEIYDHLLYDGAEHTCVAAVGPDLLCLTFNGLSKSFRVPGFRMGWVSISGPTRHAQSYIRGIELLLSMRLCSNVVAQHAIPAALAAHASVANLVNPPGRLHEQRNLAWKLLNDIPGVSCVKPQGSFYVFPRLDLKRYPITDDHRFVMDLLAREKVLVVPGTGLGWPEPNHFRMITLPLAGELTEAIGRIGRFLGYCR